MLLRRDASHPNFIWIKLKIRKGRAFRKHEQNEKYRPFYQCFCVKSYDTFSFQRRFLLKIVKNIKPRKLLLRINYIFSCFTVGHLWYDSRQKQRGTRRSFLELWITQIAGALVTRTVSYEWNVNVPNIKYVFNFSTGYETSRKTPSTNNFDPKWTAICSVWQLMLLVVEAILPKLQTANNVSRMR